MQCEQVQCLVEPDTIDRVNGHRNLGWSAANYSTFWGRALHEGKKYKLGTLNPQATVSLKKLSSNIYTKNARKIRVASLANRWRQV